MPGISPAPISDLAECLEVEASEYGSKNDRDRKLKIPVCALHFEYFLQALLSVF